MPYESLAYEVKNKVSDMGHDATYWKMGTEYDKSMLDDADAVIFILKDYYWQLKLSDVTRGARSEINRCLEQNKSVYVAYKRLDSDLRIYEAEILKDRISGIQGHFLMSSCSSKDIPQPEEIDHEFNLSETIEPSQSKYLKKHK